MKGAKDMANKASNKVDIRPDWRKKPARFFDTFTVNETIFGNSGNTMVKGVIL